MSFLAPLFLWGALALALPVVFHLVQRTTRERVPFSSLMFLSPTPLRLTRRSRLEHLLLLFLRCLALVLLSAAFARPFLKRTASTPTGNPHLRRLILVDTSASMRRPNLWAEALKRAETELRKVSPAEPVAIYTFDRGVKPVMSFEQWEATPVGERASVAMQKLAASPPGWSGTQLGQALIRGAELLAEPGRGATGEGGQIVLISDLQEGGHLSPLQGYEWPKDVEVSVQPVKPLQAGNAGLQLVPEPQDAVIAEASPGVRVRVYNSPDSRREQFQLGWARSDGLGFLGGPAAVYVPAGQSRIVPLPVPSSSAHSDGVLLRGDDADFDNHVFVVPTKPQQLHVIYFGNESEADPKRPLYFLKRAFQQTRQESVQVLEKAGSGVLDDKEAVTAALFVVAKPLGDEPLAVLKTRIAAGKTALLVLTSQALAPTLASLLGSQHVDLTEANSKDYALLGAIDFRHPLFAPFSDPKFSDFSNIHFWRHRRWTLAQSSTSGAQAAQDASSDPQQPSLQVLAKFDNGDPALVEASVGRGKVLVLTSGWQPEDSQLALSTKFVPLLYSLLDLSAGPAPFSAQYRVGDVVPILPKGNQPEPAQIRQPDGTLVNLAVGQTNFTGASMPGVYEVVSAQPHWRFAVNLDPAESQTASVSQDELAALSVPMSRSAPVLAQAAQRKLRLQDAELERRQQLWRAVLILALIVLLGETWLAGKTALSLKFQGERVRS